MMMLMKMDEFQYNLFNSGICLCGRERNITFNALRVYRLYSYEFTKRMLDEFLTKIGIWWR